jgi:hypothetical protein
VIVSALDWIRNLSLNARGEVVNVHGLEYWKHGGALEVIPPPKPACIGGHTLEGLIGFIRSYRRRVSETNALILHVISPTRVLLITELMAPYEIRHMLMNVEAVTNDFPFDQFMDVEQFIVGIQKNFVMDNAAKEMLGFVGRLKKSKSREVDDDGVSQTVTAKTGITTVGEVKVPNPVALRPYRTFLELDQPYGEYVLRIHSSDDMTKISAALYTAEGGYWQVRAMETIADYLGNRLAEEDLVEDIEVIA